MTIAKTKAFRQSQQCLFFFLFFFDIRYIVLNCQTEYLPTLFFDSIHGEEMMRMVPYTYERHLPLQNWGDIVSPCKREVPNLANVSTRS